jgi:hypothetical protein
VVDLAQAEQMVSTALVTGAAAAAQQQATAAVSETLKSLWDVVRRVFRNDPVALTAAAKLHDGDVPADEAQVWRSELAGRLDALSDADLHDLIGRAQDVLGETDPPVGTAAGRYAMALDLREAKGVQVNHGGSGHSQTNTFS